MASVPRKWEKYTPGFDDSRGACNFTPLCVLQMQVSHLTSPLFETAHGGCQGSENGVRTRVADGYSALARRPGFAYSYRRRLTTGSSSDHLEIAYMSNVLAVFRFVRLAHSNIPRVQSESSRVGENFGEIAIRRRGPVFPSPGFGSSSCCLGLRWVGGKLGEGVLERFKPG